MQTTPNSFIQTCRIRRCGDGEKQAMNEAIGAPSAAPLSARSPDLSARWRLVLLVGLVLACLLPGLFSIPIVDRDEARFAQASRQMVESGDYVVPRLGEATRFKKPIGIYWLQVGAVKLTGHDATAPIWVFRLPSLFGALLAVLVTYAVGRRMFGEEAGFLAAALIGTSLILAVEARLAKTDAVQLAAAVTGQWVLARAYLAPAGERLSRAWTLLFWGAMAVGILIKGPIVPMLAALTVATLCLWDRKAAWLKQLRPALGVPFMLVLVLPWLIAIMVHSGTDFFRESVGHDLLAKVATGQETHGLPPGAHFAVFWFAFWPGAALAAAAVPWVWANRAVPAVRFCLAWLIPFWIVFELIATKLPHYTLPAYPALALLAAAALTAPREGPDALWKRVLGALSAIGGAVGAVAGLVVLYLLERHLPPLVLSLAALVVIIALYAGRQALRLGLAAAVRVLLVEALALYVLLFAVVAPRADRLWIAPRLAAAVSHVACAVPQIMVAGFSEPSVLFVLGKDTRLGDGVTAADFLNQPGCRAVIIADHQQPLFDSRNKVLRRSPVLVTTTDGVNSANSRHLDFNIYVAAPDAPSAEGIQP
jgi:4-amino-4-deoxy-L-arabinose transferase-like glycosyltransferase